mmetsp:Transcript_44743/g.106057  ORF Transcript_44743/g.106057 Transcript_44743/m.106057 type:complete len:286 (+) Transcript_44743:114-971(+)
MAAAERRTWRGGQVMLRRGSVWVWLSLGLLATRLPLHQLLLLHRCDLRLPLRVSRAACESMELRKGMRVDLDPILQRREEVEKLLRLRDEVIVEEEEEDAVHARVRNVFRGEGVDELGCSMEVACVDHHRHHLREKLLELPAGGFSGRRRLNGAVLVGVHGGEHVTPQELHDDPVDLRPHPGGHAQVMAEAHDVQRHVEAAATEDQRGLAVVFLVFPRQSLPPVVRPPDGLHNLEVGPDVAGASSLVVGAGVGGLLEQGVEALLLLQPPHVLHRLQQLRRHSPLS